MKKLSLSLSLLALVAALSLTSCRDYETYAEQKEKEIKNIKSFIRDHGITVISEAEFYANDTTTNVDRNEFVKFEDTGIYMQIARKGEGRAQADGENRSYLFRYVEVNVATRDTVTGNLYSAIPDRMTCRRNGDTYTGTFTQGYMLQAYKSVPAGWLTFFPFITPGRPNDKGANVKIIIPDDYGHSTSVTTVAAYYYDISIMPEP